MKYSIIIPVFNSQETIEQCLNSIKNFYNENKMEVIVCDNQSNDNTAEIIKKFPFKIIQNDKKKSASSTRNLGAINSKYENLIFIDSDCVVPKNLIFILENTHNFTNAKCIAGNFSPKNIYDNFFSLYKTSYAHLKLKNKKKNISNAAIMFIKKKYFLEVGKYDENLISMEDDEFSIRFQAFGYEILFNPMLQVDHHKKYTFFSLTKNDFNRSKQLVKILKDGIQDVNSNNKKNKINNYFIWFALYFRGLINCLAVIFNVFLLINLIFNFIPSILGLNNLQLLALINFIYFLNNLDVFIFNLKIYGFTFSILTIFFQIFTFLTIIAGILSGIITEFIVPNKNKNNVPSW